MNDPDEEMNSTSSNEADIETRDKLLNNEMRAFKNRGFHDGYDEGKEAVVQEAFDSGYHKAFERNFALSTLRGVAHALKSSYNLNHQDHHQKRPTSTGSSNFSRSITNQSEDTTATSSSSSSSNSISNVSNTTGTSSNINLNISNSHLSKLESLKFDNASDIESIKNDLIKICRENRLEILAHYVSQIM